MATTSIWPVKGTLGKSIVYIENPDKTERPIIYEKSDMTEYERQRLDDVIEYASNNEKTLMKKYVSGVNCSPETAWEEMLRVKKQYGNEGGRVGFHGYQSFSEGEVTPEIAHEIGVKLAEELWGDDFQVVIATHLDHENHIHNHFVLNSVAYSDGHRYVNSKADYRKMCTNSDRICREYGLSVIEKPIPGKTKHYSEWRAEKDFAPTWRGFIKADVDEAIRASMTDTQFFIALEKKGYEIKTGKDISIRPPGKERFFRLARNFGEDYTLQAIRNRIYAQQRAVRLAPAQSPRRSRYHRVLPIHRRRKIGGLMGLYLHYQYLLGIIPKRKASRLDSFALKEDLIRLDMISAETKLLFRYRIETIEQLTAFTDTKQAEISKLTSERDLLRKNLKKQTDPVAKETIKSKITAITSSLKDLRKERRLADDIAIRSCVIRGNTRKKAFADKAAKIVEINENERILTR